MRLILDPECSAGAWPGPLRGRTATVGEEWAGLPRAAQLLSTALGVAAPGHSAGERAAQLVPVVLSTPGFWSASAEVDAFGTARRLLQWRDELVMGGWDGTSDAPRLAALGALTAAALPGLPDQLIALERAARTRDSGVERITLFIPRERLEPRWRCLLDALESRLGAVAPRLAGTGFTFRRSGLRWCYGVLNRVPADEHTRANPLGMGDLLVPAGPARAVRVSDVATLSKDSGPA